MQVSTRNSAFRRGLLDGLPFVLMAGPFALLFGVVAQEAGLHLSQIIAFSLLVIAGAAQFAALQLMIDNAAIWLVLLGALAVNLRMAMYSAALVPYLGAAPLWKRAVVAYLNFDQTYVMSVGKFERTPDMSLDARIGYFLGVAMPLTLAWVLATIVGAFIGQQLPPHGWADIIVPVMFLAMAAPLIITRAHVAAACVAAGMALALAWLPAGFGLLIAAALGMATGAYLETRAGRPA